MATNNTTPAMADLYYRLSYLRNKLLSLELTDEQKRTLQDLIDDLEDAINAAATPNQPTG